LLGSLFVCIVAFGNFEATLSMLIKEEQGPFQFSYREVCLTFAYIGVSLAIAQGLLVRRLAGRVSESAMATSGAVTEIVGFLLTVWAIRSASTPLLFVATTVVTVGFALLMPSLNSLISRRSDPARQGSILGVSQSASALARILAPVIGFPLLKQEASLPYLLASVLMVAGLAMILFAARGGRDFVPAEY
jgi:DHA1 family tetracycline resistance protein-like MFS transporter